MEVGHFQRKPSFSLIRNKTTRIIQHMVFFSYHTMAFFYRTNTIRTAYHDLIWNAICEVVGIEIVNLTSFNRFAGDDRHRLKDAFRNAFDSKASEKLGNQWPQVYVRHILRHWLDRDENADAIDKISDDDILTYIDKIFRIIQIKGRTTHAVRWYSALAKGRTIQKAQGYPHLVKVER